MYCTGVLYRYSNISFIKYEHCKVILIKHNNIIRNIFIQFIWFDYRTLNLYYLKSDYEFRIYQMFSMIIEIKSIHVHHFIITNTLILLSKLIMYIIYPVNDIILSPSGRGQGMCGFDILCKGTYNYINIIITILWYI